MELRGKYVEAREKSRHYNPAGRWPRTLQDCLKADSCSSAGIACRLWSLRGCPTSSVESQNFQAGPWQRSPRRRAVRSNQRWRPMLRKTARLLPLRSQATIGGERAYWDDGVCRRLMLSSKPIIGCVRRGGGRWTHLDSPSAAGYGSFGRGLGRFRWA
ncbi:hypothetical protein PIB30_086872 [Stylosanthes scabra]|uniref:Uncharacterized protein n=1 Tax=Stylosanthes scabra TaxID=79078 RepID=A0ABU6VTK8_9FABA|nr:hypothetical protein [Stylosanthes scabra]